MRVAAAAILGREVSYLDVDGESATGTATAVSYAKGVPIITVGDVDVPLDLISGMKIKPAS
jgi:flagellar basal-body rod modification protein FlgD